MAVRLECVSKSFRSDGGASVKAVDAITLDIPRSEFAVLLGPTGCGKTTLLNMISGLQPCTQGTVSLDPDFGQGRYVPCVFQHYTLFPWRTVLKNVAFGLAMRGEARRSRNRQARAILTEVGLAGFESAYPNELSGGMRQRVAIAQVLALSPRLLLMDEPFGALDEMTREKLQQLVIRLWREKGMTVIFVTHNIEEAVTMADRVILFSGRPGRVLHDIPVDLPRPRDPSSEAYTEMFLKVRRAFNASLGAAEK